MMNDGITSSRSMNRLMSVSTKPPLYPASAPSMTPMNVDRKATTRAICNENWVPRIVCDTMSAPSRSVPNGWSAVGFWYRGKPRSVNEYCQKALPRKANSTSRMKITTPTTAARCRRKRRAMTCHCLRADDESNWLLSAVVGAAGGTAGVVRSVKADPRVHERVKDVRDQVEHDD